MEFEYDVLDETLVISDMGVRLNLKKEHIAELKNVLGFQE